MTKEELWQKILNEVELEISPANFATWFKNTFSSYIKNDELKIAVPTDFAKERFANKYHKLIFKLLKMRIPFQN